MGREFYRTVYGDPVRVSLWVLCRDLYRDQGFGFGGLVFKVLGAWPVGVLGFGGLGPGALSFSSTLTNVTFFKILGLLITSIALYYSVLSRMLDGIFTDGGALGCLTLLMSIVRVQGLGFRVLGTLNTKSGLVKKTL